MALVPASIGTGVNRTVATPAGESAFLITLPESMMV